MRAIDKHGHMDAADSELAHAYDALIQMGPDGAWLRMAELDPDMRDNEQLAVRRLLRGAFGLTFAEAQALLVAHRRLSGEVLHTRTVELDADAGQGASRLQGRASQDAMGASSRFAVSYLVAGKVFGTSRQTVSKWVRTAMREAKHRSRT